MRGVLITDGPEAGKYWPIGYASPYTGLPLLDLGNGMVGDGKGFVLDGVFSMKHPSIEIPKGAILFGDATNAYHQELNNPLPGLGVGELLFDKPAKPSYKPFKCLGCKQALDSRDNEKKPNGEIYGCWKCGSKNIEALESRELTKEEYKDLATQINAYSAANPKTFTYNIQPISPRYPKAFGYEIIFAAIDEQIALDFAKWAAGVVYTPKTIGEMLYVPGGYAWVLKGDLNNYAYWNLKNTANLTHNNLGQRISYCHCGHKRDNHTASFSSFTSTIFYTTCNEPSCFCPHYQEKP